MNSKTLIALHVLAAFPLCAKQQPMAPIEIRFLTPETVCKDELAEHKKIASDSFFSYDTSIAADVGSKEFYDNYFEEFFESYMNQEDEEFFLMSAHDQQGTLVGGLYGRMLRGPHKVLGLEKDKKAYCISCIYVAIQHQHTGIATALIAQLVTEANKQNMPIFLYTYAIHSIARKMYENCGFSLITDTRHPNGEWTQAARALFFGDRCLIAPVAYVYRKTKP